MPPRKKGGGLGSERRKELESMFNGVDQNGDGELSFVEMSALLREGNPSLTDKELAMMFREIDVDGNLKVDFKEFVRYVNTVPPGTLKTEEEKTELVQQRQDFKKLDVNQDGELSFQELSAVLKKGNPGMKEKDLQLLFKAIDQDDSGGINFDEFCAFLSGNVTKDFYAVEEIAWSVKVPIPKAYRERQSTIDKAESCGITLKQLADFAALVKEVCEAAKLGPDQTPLPFNLASMYIVASKFLKPLTLKPKCSFVELISAEPQVPMWFVSHWWGTSFPQSVAMLKFHHEQRKVSTDDAVWMDAFALNLHTIESAAHPIWSQIQKAPFAKVILNTHCKGTVALVDDHGTALGRTWCQFECYVSTQTTQDKTLPHLYDVVSWNDSVGKAAMLYDLGGGQSTEVAAGSHNGFPLTVYQKGIKMSIQKSAATREEDKKRILHLLCGTPESNWEKKKPPADSHAYDAVNADLRPRYAGGAIYAACCHNDVRHLKKYIGDFPDYVNAGIQGGVCGIHVAAENNFLESLQLLIHVSANVNAMKKDGSTPIALAAGEGHDEALNLLLKAGADPNVTRQDGYCPLHCAIEGLHVTIIGDLLDAKANPNGGPFTESPLEMAARLEQAAYCDLLLDAGANPIKAAEKGTTNAKLEKKLQAAKEEAPAHGGKKAAHRASVMDRQVVDGLNDLAMKMAKK
mmetsp:Transcript_98759/g.175828  ORF Transcript_98759/g.175828 Transcript_98759/m.175828 type:complete len:687 (+) Transcript_98759:53-2113(+)